MTEWVETTPDTMPISGVPVSVWVLELETCLRAQWAGEKSLELSQFADSDEGCYYDEEEDMYYVEEGWYETNQFDDVNWKIEGTVTHWMPLPAPPK